MLSSLGNLLAEMGSKIRFLPVTPDIGYLPEKTAERGFFVFGNKESFLRTYDISSEPEMLSTVDFDKFYLVAIHQGLCPTGGYRIHVRGIKRSAGKIETTVEFQEPEPEQMVTLAMTTPSLFFMVPRLKGEEEPPVFYFRSTGGIPLAECKPDFGQQ
ncbi:MAG: protease complex subunit PrcB family protein [Bacillota bacterium]